MHKIIFLLFLSGFLLSCNHSFTKEEKELIMGCDKRTPFRVFLTTNKQDSVFLHKKANDIASIKNNKELKHLIKRMRATLKAENGVGIAAPQIGISRNIFLFQRIDKVGYPIEVAINPIIISHSDSIICFEGDGCLSIPDVYGNSKRYAWVEVEYTNENGKKIHERLNGYSRKGDFTSVIFQHEYDHLQGVLFIDKLCDIPEGR